MTLLRAMLTAFLLSIGLLFTTTTIQAGSPPSTDPCPIPIVAEAVRPTADAQDDPTPVPEPASMALFGIGVSSYLILRRFRKLFH
jgi:hypothetical protein